MKNVSKDSTYELYVRGVKIGERVSIELYIRSLSIVFTKPEEMEVWFYRNESDSEPFIKAKCHETGLLIFPGTQIPPAPVQESGNGDETSPGRKYAGQRQAEIGGGSARRNVSRQQFRERQLSRARGRTTAAGLENSEPGARGGQGDAIG